jgi:hypothetical protein
LEAFEVMVTAPLVAPDDCGVNVTVKLVLWPALSVAGVAIPLMLNPVPLAEACEIVTLVPPVFVKVTEAFCRFPTVTLPKVSLVGLLANCPAVTPVPDKGTVSVGFAASDASITLPLEAPAACGAKVMVNAVL